MKINKEGRKSDEMRHSTTTATKSAAGMAKEEGKIKG